MNQQLSLQSTTTQREHQHEVEELKAKIVTLEVDYTRQQSEHFAEVNKLNAEILDIRVRSDDLKLRSNELEAEINSSRHAFDGREEEFTRQQDESVDLRAKIVSLQADHPQAFDNHEETTRHYVSEVEQLSAQILTMNVTINNKGGETEQLHQLEFPSCRIEVEQLQKEMEALKAQQLLDLRKLKREKQTPTEHHLSELERRTTQIDIWRDENDEMSRQVNNAATKDGEQVQGILKTNAGLTTEVSRLKAQELTIIKEARENLVIVESELRAMAASFTSRTEAHNKLASKLNVKTKEHSEARDKEMEAQKAYNDSELELSSLRQKSARLKIRISDLVNQKNELEDEMKDKNETADVLRQV